MYTHTRIKRALISKIAEDFLSTTLYANLNKLR